jgi:sigma-B regulation protein RsbU (phosphoserine phosphatase)
MMEPAREVGGDLYDFYETDDGTLCFLVGDVYGKGAAAALFMARTKNLVRLLTRLLPGKAGSPPTTADVITAVNRELCQDNAAMMFVSLFFAMLDPRTGELQFTNAGHNPPYCLNGDGVTPIADPKGRPLGARGDSLYRTGRLSLMPGATLYLFTDGITEAANGEHKFFGEARLEAVLRGAASGSARELITAVTEAVRSHVSGAPQSDDITAMAIRRLGPSAK